jgi:hypothetical protein
MPIERIGGLGPAPAIPEGEVQPCASCFSGGPEGGLDPVLAGEPADTKLYPVSEESEEEEEDPEW